MATRIPLVIASGQIEQLQAGDSISGVGTLSGDPDRVLYYDASGLLATSTGLQYDGTAFSFDIGNVTSRLQLAGSAACVGTFGGDVGLFDTFGNPLAVSDVNTGIGYFGTHTLIHEGASEKWTANDSWVFNEVFGGGEFRIQSNILPNFFQADYATGNISLFASSTANLGSAQGILFIADCVNPGGPVPSSLGCALYSEAGVLTAVDGFGGITILAPSPNIIGPASSTDNAVVRFDGTTGALVKNSTVLITDSGIVLGMTEIDGGIVFNGVGQAVDLRVESDTNANMLFVDGTNNRVGVSTGLPTTTFDVLNSFTVASTGAVVVNEAGAAVNFRVESDNQVNALFVDGTNNRVGILTGTPTTTFDVLNSFTVASTGAVVANEAGAAVNFRVESDNNANMILVNGTTDRVGIGVTTPSTTFDVLNSFTVASTGAVVANEAGAAVDIRMEGDTDVNLLFLQGSTDRVGIGTASPTTKFDVLNSFTVATTGAVVVNETGAAVNFRVESDNQVNALFVDGTNDRVGVLTGTPTTTFDVLNSFTVASTGAVVVNETQADADFRVEGDSISHLLFTDATSTTENIAMCATAQPNWQTMDRGIFLGDTQQAPTGNPSAGIFLWSESGELKARDGSGNVVILTDVSEKLPDIQVYTTVGTSVWTKPAGAVSVISHLIGGGGGGSGGRRGALLSIRGGGGAGGGGGYRTATFAAGSLGATENVVVGGAGTAGTAVQTDGTSGANDSTNGNNSTFSTATAGGGGRGLPGTNTDGGAGGAGGTGTIAGGAGGHGGGTGTGTTGGADTSAKAGAGGGGGWGITALNNLDLGGFGGDSSGRGGPWGATTSATSGDGLGGQGAQTVVLPNFVGLTGGGGGGGGANLSPATVGQAICNGGTAGFFGGGGGGGGGTTDGANGFRQGGNGAPGFAVIITLFA